MPEIDEETIARFAEGDAEAGREIYLKYKRLVAFWIVRAAPSWSVEEQEDAMQEVWAKAIRGSSGLRAVGPAGFSAWLRRIAINAVCDGGRARQRDAIAFSDDLLLEALPLEGPGVEERAAARESFGRFVARLSPRRRAVLELCFIKGTTVEEAADELGESKWLVRRVVRKLRKEAADFIRMEEAAVRCPEFLAALDEREMTVFREHFVGKCSISALSRKLGVSRWKAGGLAAELREKIRTNAKLRALLEL